MLLLFNSSPSSPLLCYCYYFTYYTYIFYKFNNIVLNIILYNFKSFKKGGSRHPHAKKKKNLNTDFITFLKINSKWIIDLTVK